MMKYGKKNNIRWVAFASKALQNRDAFRIAELYKLSMPSFGPD